MYIAVRIPFELIGGECIHCGVIGPISPDTVESYKQELLRVLAKNEMTDASVTVTDDRPRRNSKSPTQAEDYFYQVIEPGKTPADVIMTMGKTRYKALIG